MRSCRCRRRSSSRRRRCCRQHSRSSSNGPASIRRLMAAAAGLASLAAAGQGRVELAVSRIDAGQGLRGELEHKGGERALQGGSQAAARRGGCRRGAMNVS